LNTYAEDKYKISYSLKGKYTGEYLTDARVELREKQKANKKQIKGNKRR
jgi:hypothetical protein